MAIADGQVLTAADFLPYAQLAAAPTSFVPTWDGVTVGNGFTAGRWARIGPLVCVEMELIFGSTTTVTDYLLQPLTGLPQSLYAVGGGWAYDSSAAAFHPVAWRQGDWIAANGERVSSTWPWTWTSGDQLRLSMTYLTTP